VESFDLRIPALILAIMLPVISAVQLGRERGVFVLRYVRCLIAYFFVWVFLALGYAFQSAILPLPADEWPFFFTFSTLDKIVLSIRGEYQDLGNLTVVALAASIVTFCLLMGKDRRSRSVNTLRTAFVTLVTLDVLVGMIVGYDVSKYILNIVLDFAGAFLLGIFAPYAVQMAVSLPECD
jgi:hypothetical protein